jgi:hypothetical protein
VGDTIRSANDLVTSGYDSAPKLEVREVDDVPSAELLRDVQAQALQSSLTAHALIDASQELMRRILALKLRAAVDSSHRVEANAAILRTVFASQRTASVDALAGALGDIDAVADDLQRHLDGSLEATLDSA